MLFKPMLAVDAVLDKLKYPVLASPKLDGIRAVVRDGVVYSRSNKPIPNKYVQSLYANCEHYDGELIVGEPTSPTVYRDTVSHVMAHDKQDFDVRFYVFDYVNNLKAPYIARNSELNLFSEKDDDEHVKVLRQQIINDEVELVAYEAKCLELGYEGLILRAPYSPYKMGRSTVNEGYLLKVKQFVDAEAEVIGFEERMQNNNEKTTNELGRSTRSSHKAGKSGRGDLGAILVRHNDVEFAIGTGFDDAERADIWQNCEHYLGKLVKFKYFPVGVKDAPRHPVFLGWRDLKDMS